MLARQPGTGASLSPPHGPRPVRAARALVHRIARAAQSREGLEELVAAERTIRQVPPDRERLRVVGAEVPLLEAQLENPKIGRDADNPDLCEYVVGVDWIKTLSPEQALWEKGMFANQNTAVRLRDPFTLERLTALFGLEPDEESPSNTDR
jgi:hypothetical protein